MSRKKVPFSEGTSNKSAIPPAPPPAAPSLSIEPHLPIEPPGWVLPLTRRGQPQPWPQPRPFDYAACLKRREQASSDAQAAWWQITDELFPPVVSPEEARFWLLA